MYEEKFRETTTDSTREQLLPRPRGVSFRGKVGVVSHPKSHPTSMFGYTNPEGDWRGLNPLLVKND